MGVAAPGSGKPRFDTAAANAALDGLGYARGSDGVRRADGERMAYTLLRPSGNSTFARIVAIVRQGLEAVGVEIRDKPTDEGALYDAVVAPDGKYLDSDMHVWDFFPDPSPDFFATLLTTDQLGNNNDNGVSDPAYDRLVAQLDGVVDAAARRPILERAERYQSEQAWYNVLVVTKRLVPHRDGIEGIAANPKSPVAPLAVTSIVKSA
jgi:peptide/nickel transport system substrate-binding protein